MPTHPHVFGPLPVTREVQTGHCDRMGCTNDKTYCMHWQTGPADLPWTFNRTAVCDEHTAEARNNFTALEPNGCIVRLHSHPDDLSDCEPWKPGWLS